MINSQHTAETEITANIQNLITARGITRKRVFDAANISRTTFDRGMSGARSFTIREVLKIAAALEVSPDQLFPTEWADDNTQAA